MNSTELTIDSEEQKLLKPEVLIIGFVGAAAAIAILSFLLKKTISIETDPPPIIIKDGSFIIDSVAGFRDAGDITGNSKRKKVNRYKGDFGVITKVLVNHINERFVSNTSPIRPFGYYYSNPSGVIIQLWFQKLISENPERWDSNDVNGVPDVVSRVSIPTGLELPTLELELPADLTKSNQNKHHKRKNKDKLDSKKDPSGSDRYFRIGRIQVLNFNGTLKKEFISSDDDVFNISLWDS